MSSSPLPDHDCPVSVGAACILHAADLYVGKPITTLRSSGTRNNNIFIRSYRSSRRRSACTCARRVQLAISSGTSVPPRALFRTSLIFRRRARIQQRSPVPGRVCVTVVGRTTTRYAYGTLAAVSRLLCPERETITRRMRRRRRRVVVFSLARCSAVRGKHGPKTRKTRSRSLGRAAPFCVVRFARCVRTRVHVSRMGYGFVVTRCR